MPNQQMQHFDRAADHFRDAILVVQDVICGMMGVIGALLVVFNSFELGAHPREAGTLVAAGAVLIAFAVIRWAFRRSAR
jgi:TRAP-type mannitol/chloroaromatic compound transport system permease large subunit